MSRKLPLAGVRIADMALLYVLLSLGLNIVVVRGVPLPTAREGYRQATLQAMLVAAIN